MNRFFAPLLLMVLPTVGHAGEIAEARNMLSNWGLAYCINAVSTEKPINTEAQRTMGAYFERGAHNSEDAYMEVRKYFTRKLSTKTLVNKQTGKVMPLVTCMDLIQTKEFTRVINDQDRHVALGREGK